jgi:predicted aspartyl protease
MARDIRKKVTVCGPKGCASVEGLVDTGASMTMMSRELAERIGIDARHNGVKAHGIDGPAFDVKDGEATVCLPGRCACRKVKAMVHSNTGGFDLIVGMDYLGDAKAKIDAAAGKLRCGCAGTKRPRRRAS